MRPYLVLIAAVLMAVSAFAQAPVPYYGSCFYGCGPYFPRLTTPEISFQQFSPNPVGASNATTGLIAGATNSTLSQNQAPTSSVYTVAVWYQGGDAPLISPQIHLWPEAIGREGHPMHGGMHEEYFREERSRQEHGQRAETARGGWMYFTGREHTSDAALVASEAKGVRKAAHVYNNDDVTRQNDNNGNVKYNGKSEKM